MEKVINILLIEDDLVDVMDAQRTLDRVGLFYKMKVSKNGEEALEWLASLGDDKSKFPDVILLDLNMPKMNGLEFLKVLRSTPIWRDSRVFIITTSEQQEDRALTNKLGVSGYIVKPLKFNN